MITLAEMKIEENPTWFIMIENNNTKLKLEKKVRFTLHFITAHCKWLKNSCILVMSLLLELPYEVSEEANA